MAEKLFELDGIGIIRVTKRRGSRSIRMTFADNGDVKISIPAWATFHSGLKFALERQEWLRKHKPASKAPYEEGQRIGKAHRLYFIKSYEASKPSVRVSAIKVRITYPAALPTTDPSVQTAAERGAKKALQNEAASLLPPRLKDLAIKHGFTYKSVSVKQLKTRWGSCDQSRHITLNYYLMQVPWELIDYVLIHELVHTEHLNHSDEFWARFDQALPNAKQVRKLLKPYRTSVLAQS